MTHYPNAAVHAMPARGAATSAASAQPAANNNAAPMRQLYLALSNGAPAGHEVQAAADWLAAQLTRAQLAAARNARAAALPSDGAPFAAWHAAVSYTH